MSYIQKEISDYNMSRILRLKGFIKLISQACSVSTVILQAPAQERDKPDSYELRGKMWAASTLHSLLPSFVDKQGFELGVQVGIEGTKLQTSYVESLSSSLVQRLSSSLPPFPSSSSQEFANHPSSSPLSSSLGFPHLAPSPYPIRELSRLCLLVIDHPSMLPLIEKLICLQPGTTPEFQLDPLFVTRILATSGVFSEISLSSKYALWIHSSNIFSIMVSSMIEVSTERVFLHASALESILQTSAVCHVIMRHPSLYNEFLRRMEASWLNSRAFAVLRLARATHACLLRMRMSDPRSLPISDYFDTRCATFTSVLGRPVRAGDTQRMIDDAQRMNAQRRLMCVETPDACAQLWMVMFLFVEWTCDALLALIFTSKRSALSPLAEYIAWLVNPNPTDEEEGEAEEEVDERGQQTSYMELSKQFLSIQLSPSVLEKEEKGVEGERKVEQEVLDVICSLPLPRELALQVIAKYISHHHLSDDHCLFLIRFACFGKTGLQATDLPTTAQSQAFGLFLVETIAKTCKLAPRVCDVIMTWLGKLDKATHQYIHEQDVKIRIADIKLKCKV